MRLNLEAILLTSCRLRIAQVWILAAKLESIKYVASKNGAKGVIDEIAISNKQKTEKEIQHDMTALSLAVKPNGKLTTIWGNIKVGY